MQNLLEFYLGLKKKYPNKPAFATKQADKTFLSKSYSELIDDAYSFSEGLDNIEPGDRIALFADNCYAWMVTSIGICFSGAADVPRASDVTEQDIEYILNHSESKILVVENANVLKKILQVESKLTSLKEIIVLDESGLESGSVKSSKFKLQNFIDVIEKGKIAKSKSPKALEERLSRIKGNDLFTLIYTSGTTGAPKGVMLSHSNILSQVDYMPINLEEDDRALSILPVWHIFERIFEIFSMANGACTYYTSVRSLKEDLAIVKPTFMASAPRLWESIYGGIQGNILKASTTKKLFFSIATNLARTHFRTLQVLKGRDLRLVSKPFFRKVFDFISSLFLFLVSLVPYLIFDSIVLSKIRKATGGNLRGSVSGGGALPFHVDEFFNTIGIPVLEGYGMTETSPVIAVRTQDNLVAGTVGPLYGGTEIRLVDWKTGEVFLDTTLGLIEYGRKGEIHVNGPQVMQGYFKNPEATSKVLKDGWMNTGDLGIFTANDCLKIVGRTKETIVLLGGENVEPVPIEAKLLESEFIDQCMVVGQDRKFLSALIVPNIQALSEYGTDLSQIAKTTKVKEKIENEVKTKINAGEGFKSFERVVEIAVLSKPFEVGDELTAKLSLKRHVITEKYAENIEEMYK
ncbi:AMP-dependent synthetase/ligase [Leptospira ilyithenensis]|uniref:Long-chain fatty acid--CoA ligase n=1 Tax=Leptospira ilyithenensis TaxID=2484901 RepID=A0A4R9LSE9_9LEPT|nr:long-chain fatty acid--CoA ligase [Leptospira ilyithenensis]TGN14291.1 long-chain fatty acid--CoA ligase [Leptospira ilyithenensis]